MSSLLSGFGGSSYLGIAAQYMQGARISSTFRGATADTSAPPRSAPKASDLGAEVAKLGLPLDPDALYIVYTSNLPKVNYCAWHDWATQDNVAIQVAYVPMQPHSCSPLTVSDLHANGYSDTTQAAADSTAHEFMEAITDPHINAWYDQRGAEIGDKCDYTYQSVVTLANGSTWQIQEEWSNAISGCQQQ